MIFFNELYVVSIFLSSWIFWVLVPERFRTKFLVTTSFLALCSIQPWFTLFLVAFIVFVYYGGKLIENSENFKVLITLILILVAVLLLFKYGGYIFALIFSSENQFSKNYLVPLGISYLAFKLISYVTDIYRGDIKKPQLEDLLAFVLFLPAFPAGPIEKFQNFTGLRSNGFSMEFYAQGLRRIALGYFKKVVIVNFALNEIVVKRLYPLIKADGVNLELSGIIILAFLIGSLLYAYFDLSGYADIAIGFGQLFGYKLCENMNYPIFQKNISDYWNCWHISLSHWCRNNVYFPVLGQTRNNVTALYSSFIVMGLWHHINLNWLLWGIWHASGIQVFSKWNRYKRKHKGIRRILSHKAAAPFGIMLTMLFSSLGFSFIMMDNARLSLRVLLAIFV